MPIKVNTKKWDLDDAARDIYIGPVIVDKAHHLERYCLLATHNADRENFCPLEHLVAFALKIGLFEKDIQWMGAFDVVECKMPVFELTLEERKKAIDLGAQQVDTQFMRYVMWTWENEGV